jgi:hypothetical protein
MELILIQSGLKRILMLDAILSYDDRSILGVRQFIDEQRCCAIESCVQLCAMHVRKLKEFNCHAFLLSISSIKPLPPKLLNGLGRCEGRLTGISQRALSYDVSLKIRGLVPIVMKLTIGITKYDKMFDEAVLKKHYQRLFESLDRNNIDHKLSYG